MCKHTPIPSALTTKESEESRERTEAELKVPDPEKEQARAILLNDPDQESKT